MQTTAENSQINIQFTKPKYWFGQRLLTIVSGQVPKTVVVIGMCFNPRLNSWFYAVICEAERELVK